MARVEGLPTRRALRILEEAGFFVRSAASTIGPHEIAAIKKAVQQAGPGTRQLWAAELAADIRGDAPRQDARRPGSPRPAVPAPRPASSAPFPDAESESIYDYLKAGSSSSSTTASKLTRLQAEVQLFGTPESRFVASPVARHAAEAQLAERAAAEREQRRCQAWRPYRFDDDASRAWVEGGLDIDKPDVAAAARRAGITPDDLRTRVHGARVAARLNGGESAVSVRARLVEDRQRTS